ncbi:unnamed protein product [Schistocephalus solidus]|uniref:G_PROTEIN_RECEP_F1_2 domain-containing protein n=1 Tax=Schistocephalus solidus TaxID=70667 RepID=A0A183SLX5_SCHSO|nr:unnamed protein product [Schistocephalus solidus]
MTADSKPFWSCEEDTHWPSDLDICIIILDIFGFIANLTVTILLFLLRAKKSEDLVLLRVLSLSCLVATLVSFVDEVVGNSRITGNVFLDDLICVLWSTRFLYWYSKAQVYHGFFYFACNRAFEVLSMQHYRLTTETQRLTAYLLLVFICSFLSTAPQLLQAQPQVKNCACAPPTEDWAILTIIYAHSFLWVAFFLVIYPAILVYICIALLVRLWRMERVDMVDELDKLSFPESGSSSSPSPGITPSTFSVSFSTHADACDGDMCNAVVPKTSDEVSAHHVWSASFCIIPLTTAYIATFSCDAIYQLLSTTGYLTYVLHSPSQNSSEVLLDLFIALVPVILFFHIPAMRSLILTSIACIKKRCNKD